MAGVDSSFRVLLADEIAPEGVAILEGSEGVQVDLRGGISAGELKEIIGDYDAVIVRSRSKVTAEVIEAGKRLKVIG